VAGRRAPHEGSEHGCYATIADAVAAAADGDTVCLEAGTYTESVDLGGKDLTLLGAGSAYSVVDVSGGPIEVDGGPLSGLTIQNGTGTGYSGGGAVICTADTLTIEDVVLSGNVCSTYWCYGPVIYADDCDVLLDNVRFEDNTTTGDSVIGGLVYAYQSSLTATDVSAVDNTVVGGAVTGGLFSVRDGSASFTGLTVTGNSVSATHDVYGGVGWFYGGAAAAFNHGRFDTNTISAPHQSVYGGILEGSANDLSLT
jgi:hypothetical protein